MNGTLFLIIASAEIALMALSFYAGMKFTELDRKDDDDE